MLFSSGVFIFIFLPVFIFLYFLPVNSIKYKNVIIVLFSIVFYAWGEPIFVFIMLASVIFDWIMGMAIYSSKYKTMLITFAIVTHVSILLFYKYLSFFSKEVSLLFHTKTYQIALPIGISFFTFQMMSYLIDVYRNDTKPQKNLGKLVLYIMMFPQLIAGPIIRYTDVSTQINKRIINWDNIIKGSFRFFVGLGKKIILADYLAMIANSIFGVANYEEVATLAYWIGAVAYTLEIYFDFSGYSDMAIGLAKIMGFEFKENFNYPYISTSVTEFWKRWHISLTDWFRDYIYIPLGGNRVTKAKHIFNLSLVWLLTGFWHGANWTFLLWGIIYLIIILFERFAIKKFIIPKIIGWVFTMVIVICNWVIFRSDSIGIAFNYIKNMFTFNTFKTLLIDKHSLYYLQQSLVIFLISIICCIPWYKHKIFKIIPQKEKYLIKIIYGFIIFCLSCILILNSNYSPFIYFNF